jgi:hypothetical protein
MQRLEVSGAVRHIYMCVSLGVKGLKVLQYPRLEILNQETSV